LKRAKYQELIKEAEGVDKIVDFVNAHPELMPEWAQSIWQVAHATVAEMLETLGISVSAFCSATGFGRRAVDYWLHDQGRCQEPVRIALAEMCGYVKVPLEW